MDGKDGGTKIGRELLSMSLWCWRGFDDKVRCSRQPCQAGINGCTSICRLYARLPIHHNTTRASRLPLSLVPGLPLRDTLDRRSARNPNFLQFRIQTFETVVTIEKSPSSTTLANALTEHGRTLADAGDTMEKFLRKWRQDAVDKHQYDSAIFIGDKLLALTGELAIPLRSPLYSSTA